MTGRFPAPVLLAVLATACSEDPAGPALAERGRAALEAGNVEAGLADLEASLGELPEGAERTRVRRDLELARARLGRAETAEGFLTWAAEHPNVVRPGDRVEAARAFLAAGRPGPALDLLESGLLADPRFDALRGLDEELRAAVETDAGAARALWMLGEVELEHFRRTRDLEWLNRALVSFVGSLESSPATPEDRLHANLGQGWCYFWRGIFEDLDDFQTPRAVFEQILLGFPDDPQALMGLGTCMLHQDELEAAQTNLERALALDPGLALGWFGLGQVHVRRGDWGAADAAFARADEADPDRADTLVWRAIAASETGRDPAARELLGRALELDPDNVQAMVQLGIVHARARRFEDALPWLERALALDPDNGNAYVQRGKVQAQLGDLQKAAASLHQACALLPDSYEAHYNLGALLASFGDHANALAYLEKALELDPDGPNADALRLAIDEVRGRLAIEGAR